ncbi:hypothetical protein SUGI_0377930 [Cryptomeria japonica]|uniref:GDSL esterase/lipase LIP-4 n=1 Tax=Cryptomeria japonica TaxID=3369 RepID=UPI00240895F7|nr:GDSL esterase/lipase LIP-4 [Cryptomeria japonica]GLJ20738.1 hypothetical protein SUGI_0377930 [Cryptomeria japonica]
MMVPWAALISALLVAAVGRNIGVAASGGCHISAIFNFGDSNSDTGGQVAGLGLSSLLPNGETFFKRPAGRVCDGRLIIDFLSEGMQLPFLSPYLESVGSNFSHGANFAINGATVSRTGNTFPLPVQIDQFKRFKARVLDIISRGENGGNLLPTWEAFEKGLYTIDIGQNDIFHAFTGNLALHQIINFVIPQTVDDIKSHLKDLYSEGGRNFVVHNTGPLGCLPRILAGIRSDLSELDKNGCAVAYNNASQTFNALLKAACTQLTSNLPQATIVYVDIYSIKYALIANASQYGIEHPLAACCGYGGLPYNFNDKVRCAQTEGNVNGSVVIAGSCKNPSKSANWDGTHYTERANFLVWSEIMSSKYSHPPLSPYQACY